MQHLPGSSRKIVIDTSALISLSHGGLLDLVLEEFRVVVSDLIIEELKKMAEYDDEDGKAAREILTEISRLEMRAIDMKEIGRIVTSRLDEGEASCVLLAQAEDIEALISDDFKAMHQLQYYSSQHSFDLGLGAALIHALVLRGKLSKAEALESIERIASKRDWLGRSIYNAYTKSLQGD